ncbi:MAG: redoxin domain-containing protein [Clostridia bacterium]|nr:redoxin domain-containing protein [Clostridia bacterium]
MNITWLEVLTTLIEGLITFISPCVLPMIPVYVLYFAGSSEGKQARRTLARALSFVLGFTALFVLLGVFAGSLGGLLVRYQREVNLICGMIMILFGLHYAGILHITLLDKTVKPDVQVQPKGYLSCALLGAVFAVGWTPCTGPLLGSAMMLAASKGSMLSGAALLASYSLGMGIPFVLCALLIDRVKGAFAAIKRHYKLINRVCGVFLVAVGLMMMTGLYSRFSLMLQSGAVQTQTASVQETPVQTAEPVIEATAEPEPITALEAKDEPVIEATAEPEKTEAPKAEVMGPVMRNMAQDFTAYDDAGNPVSLKEMRGKPVVVNFFASWCGPCRMEMPYFDEFYHQYGDQVTFMMVNLCAFGNDTKENGKKMVEDGGWTFPVYFDSDGDAALKYAIRSMPTTIFVSAEGELKGRHTGVIPRDTLEKTIQAMIAE